MESYDQPCPERIWHIKAKDSSFMRNFQKFFANQQFFMRNIVLTYQVLNLIVSVSNVNV